MRLPKIVAFLLQVDRQSKTLKARTASTCTMVNRTANTIDRVLVDVANDLPSLAVTLDSMSFDQSATQAYIRYQEGLLALFALRDLIGERALHSALALRKVKIVTGTANFEFTVKTKPSRAGIDPYNLLIDRNPGDNSKEVVVKK